MTTLIVGCGYLGRRAARLLLARGDRVVGAVRSESSAAELESLGIEPAIIDVLEPASLLRLPKPDRVLYCVARDKSRPNSMRRTYVEGLANFLETGLASNARLVYAGSTSVFSQTDGSWVNEASATQPTSESGRICLEAEETLHLLAPTASIVRFSGLYGPGRLIGRDSLRARLVIEGDPERFLNLIHVDDAALAVVSVLDSPSPERLYLASDSLPIPRRHWYDLVAAHDGLPPPRFTLDVAPSEPNRRVSNRLLLESLGITLSYPTVGDFWRTADPPSAP